LIKSLLIGSQLFTNNLIQGPLAGVSCAPFRRLVWKYSQPAFTYTEMISSKTLINLSKQSYSRFVKKAPDEGPVCFQLSGTDPLELSVAAKIVTDNNADLIDLNCGCPVKKIRSKGAGSKLLTNPSHLYRLICALKKSTHVPVSVKIRVDAESGDKFNTDVANAIQDAGADFVVVHGRHWTEHYETTCHFEEIKFFVNALKIPVIGNGDVSCIDSLQKLFSTGCAGVMVSRAGVGQPWLIAKLNAQMKQQDYTPPSKKEIGDVFLEHVLGLTELVESEKFAILQARKFSKYYARGLNNKSQFCEEINLCENLATLNLIVNRYFG
jgi:tRNA-dihydrouridine synthase B